MMDERGQNLLELQEESFSRRIPVGKHVPFHSERFADMGEHIPVLRFEKRGRRNSNSLIPGRKHRPAVATTLRDEKLFSRRQQIQHLQIVDSALAAVGKSESWCLLKISLILRICAICEICGTRTFPRLFRIHRICGTRFSMKIQVAVLDSH